MKHKRKQIRKLKKRIAELEVNATPKPAIAGDLVDAIAMWRETTADYAATNPWAYEEWEQGRYL